MNVCLTNEFGDPHFLIFIVSEISKPEFREANGFGDLCKINEILIIIIIII